MTSRKLVIPILALALALALAAACGGGGNDARPPGRLTDPASVPTATPWTEPPEPIILEPGALTPVSQDGNGEEDGGGGGGDTGGEVRPVTPFKVKVDETTNRRTGPSTDEGVAGTIKPSEEPTVVGEANGEEVDAGNDVWYQLEDGSFVYSGAVTKVEE